MKLIFIIFIIFFNCYSFFFNYRGFYPESWFQIKSKYHNIVFTQNFSEQGEFLSEYIDFISPIVYSDLQFEEKLRIKRIDIRLISQNSYIANGYVSVYPFHSVWWPNFIPYLTITPWYKTLAIHELRHAAQFNNNFFNIFAALMPNWFFEGDAVVAESIYSEFGRGRIPFFERYLRTQLLTIPKKDFFKKYNYQRFYFGSDKNDYKNFNFYNIGYQMVGYIYVNQPFVIKNRSKKKTWQKIINEGYRFYSLEIFELLVTKNYLLTLPTFSGFLEKYSGNSKTELYNKTLSLRRKQWQNQYQKIYLQPNKTQIFSKQKIKKIITNKKKYNTYLNVSTRNKIYFLKAEYNGNSSSLYKYTKNKENYSSKKIIDLPISTLSGKSIGFDNFSIGNEKIAFLKSIQDIRYSGAGKNQIVIYNLKTKKQKEILKKINPRSVTIANDDSKVLITFYDEKYHLQLVIYSLSDLEKIVEIDLGLAAAAYDFSWDENNSKFFFVKVDQHPSRHSIVSFDFVNKKVKEYLLSKSDDIVRQPFVDEKNLFYVSSYNGIDNIYCLDLETQKKYQVTARPYSATRPKVVNIDGEQRIYFNDYSFYGERLSYLMKNENKWLPIQKTIRHHLKIPEKIIEKSEIKKFDEKKIDIIDKKNNIEKYKNNLNLVSVVPDTSVILLNDPFIRFDFLEVRIDVKDSLQSMESYLSSGYDINKKTFYFDFNNRLATFFPILNFRVFYQSRSIEKREDNSYLLPSFEIYFPLVFGDNFHSIRFTLYSEFYSYYRLKQFKQQSFTSHFYYQISFNHFSSIGGSFSQGYVYKTNDENIFNVKKDDVIDYIYNHLVFFKAWQKIANFRFKFSHYLYLNKLEKTFVNKNWRMHNSGVQLRNSSLYQAGLDAKDILNLNSQVALPLFHIDFALFEIIYFRSFYLELGSDFLWGNFLNQDLIQNQGLVLFITSYQEFSIYPMSQKFRFGISYSYDVLNKKNDYSLFLELNFLSFSL